jgi:F0F1-type ATP synthase membrane subunit b/b'
MPPEYEPEPLRDDEGYGPEPEEDDPAPDPLADYDDDTRALIEQEREKARAEAKAEAESEIGDFKAKYGRRYNATIKDLRDQGYDVADDGKVLVRDANQAAAAFKNNVVPLALGQAPTAQEEEITLDPYDTAEELTRKANALADRKVSKAVEEATKPLMEALNEIRGYMGQQAEAPAEEAARAQLEKIGLGAVADDPEFAKEYRAALKQGASQYGPQVLHDPGFIRMTAGMVAMNMPDDVLQKARQPVQGGPSPQQRASAAMRNSTGALGPSRGMGSAEYTEADRSGAELLGVSIEEYRRLGEDATVDDTLARRRKQNGVGRR